MTMTEISTGWATRRARRGAALLDRRDPGWARRIHLAALDMQRFGLCIAGQLARVHPALPAAAACEYDWYVGDFLGLGFAGQIEHGFLVSLAWTGDDLAWELLSLAWTSEVAARVDQAVLQHALPMPPTEPAHA
jgi:hypothetical protein